MQWQVEQVKKAIQAQLDSYNHAYVQMHQNVNPTVMALQEQIALLDY